MKKKVYTLAFVTLIAGTLMMSCKPSTKEGNESQEKIQQAKENVQDAQDSLAVARKAATDEEWAAFKEKTDSVINDNKNRIAELKLNAKKTGKSINDNYEKNIEILEQKNNALKLKMEDYKNDASSDWQSFKREFNHDMDEMGQAFKDLTVDNKN